MTSLTGDTDVFSSAAGADAHRRALVMFLAKRQHGQDTAEIARHRRAILEVLAALGGEGWLLSLRSIFDGSEKGPWGLDTGFTHDHDFAGVWEAPDINAAMAGTVRLEEAGWTRLFSTEWLLGVKEFAPVLGEGAITTHRWAFLALWDWNDEWNRASESERAEYDRECDIAFKGDLALGVNIAGRYRMDWSNRWHHLGAWEIAGPDIADAAIRGHEDVADFKFTTSRHIVGRQEPMADLIAPGRH